MRYQYISLSQLWHLGLLSWNQWCKAPSHGHGESRMSGEQFWSRAPYRTRGLLPLVFQCTSPRDAASEHLPIQYHGVCQTISPVGGDGRHGPDKMWGLGSGRGLQSPFWFSATHTKLLRKCSWSGQCIPAPSLAPCAHHPMPHWFQWLWDSDWISGRCQGTEPWCLEVFSAACHFWQHSDLVHSGADAPWCCHSPRKLAQGSQDPSWNTLTC